MSNSQASTNNIIQPKFIITATPVCYVRPFTPLTPQIDVSRERSSEFCEPLFIALSTDDIQLSNDYIRELQAQGVDKLAESLQSILDSLPDRDYMEKVKSALRDEIFNCRDFAKEFRNHIAKSNLCNGCNDWMRGGCSSTCSVYGKESNHA
ncbi:TPA: hypothetical protein VEO38_003551 [Providencia alcalifaciens]|nr:hypothetical protein [Providencia alcalifaciens]